MRAVAGFPITLILAAALFSSCAVDGRSRSIRAFEPYRIAPRPAAAPDLDPAIRAFIGRTVWVSPDGTGIDTLRSCYALRIPYMRNASRGNLDPYRIESVRRDDRFAQFMVAVLVGPRGAREKLWFENDESAFLEEISADFLLEDPYAAHADWTPETWDAIHRQEPAPEMTPEQVLLAIGRPAREEPSRDGTLRWIYPWFGAVLTFDRGLRLVSAEVEDPWL